VPDQHSEILIVGGGVAGLSAAAALAEHRRVTVLEAEESIGYHSSGRSATMLHYALGDRLVRALTLASRSFFEAPPEGFSDAPLSHRVPVLVHARTEEQDQLDELEAAIAPFATLERLGVAGMRELSPLLRFGPGASEHGLADHEGLRLDTHALLQGFDRRVRSLGGSIVSDARVAAISRANDRWQVETERGARFTCDLLINAAGAWGDVVAGLAGVAPLGLTSLRRTIITFDPPAGSDVAGLPFTKTVGDELYFAPESGRLFASPMDEVPTDPCDAQPEEYDVALAAFRVEERTTMEVKRVQHRWAGLRTFAPDRRPVVGYDANAAGFFWLVGQGGFGLQTSPVMAAITASLIAGTPWPLDSVAAEELSPLRFG
jgi:D-arginine dehydrogenase